MALARNATVTTISSKPCRRSRSMMCSIIGRLATGSIGLGAFEVSGRSRVPSPPAMITAFIAVPRSPCPRRRRPRYDRDVGEGGVVAEHQAGDAEDPRSAAEARVAREVGAAAAGTRERRTSTPNVPALPSHWTSKRFMPSSVSDRQGRRRRAPRGRRRGCENHSGAPSAMMMAADADDEQEAVGGGVEHLAELATPGRSGGRCSRRPSRWRRGRPRRAAAATRLSRPNSSHRNSGMWRGARR